MEEWTGGWISHLEAHVHSDANEEQNALLVQRSQKKVIDRIWPEYGTSGI